MVDVMLPDWVLDATDDAVEQIVEPDLYRDEPGAELLPLAERMIQWIEKEFYVPELSGPVILFPYHKAVIREAFRQDAGGKFIYDFVLWGDIKKSIKSCIAAAVVLYRALHTHWGSFKIVGNDLKQADSRVFFYIKRALELNPRLHATIRNYKISFPNHSFIEAIPVDPDGEAGGGDEMIEFTELHAFHGRAAEKLWTEMTIPPTKHGFAQRWADTYAGQSGESPILEPIHAKLVKPENRLTLDGLPDDFPIFALGRILCMWNEEPRLPWQTPEYYASEEATLLPEEFLRVHRNQWTSSVAAFVPKDWWKACQGTLPTMDRYLEIVVAMDAGISSDCFGIIAVARAGDLVYPVVIRKWQPQKNQKLDFSNALDPNDVEYPEGFVRQLARDFNVICFTYDPHQLHDMASRLTQESIGFFEAFNQGEQRLVADKKLYDLIRDRRFVHDGNADLTEHVLNANRKADGEYLRIIKRADHLKIDLTVCASMASSKAYQYLPG